MRFLRSPIEILPGESGRVKALKLEIMRLESRGSKQVASPSGTYEDIPVENLLHTHTWLMHSNLVSYTRAHAQQKLALDVRKIGNLHWKA